MVKVAGRCPGLDGITKAFFSLGSRIGLFERLGWADGLIEDIQAATTSEADSTVYNSAYPIDLDLGGAEENIQTGNMEVLANQFQQLAMRREQDAINEKAKDDRPMAPV